MSQYLGADSFELICRVNFIIKVGWIIMLDGQEGFTNSLDFSRSNFTIIFKFNSIVNDDMTWISDHFHFLFLFGMS